MVSNQDDRTTPGFRSLRDASAEGGPDAAASGTRIGDYIVRRVLGEGGMGIVVAATHLTLGQRVAWELSGPELVVTAQIGGDPLFNRFTNEALVTALEAMKKSTRSLKVLGSYAI